MANINSDWSGKVDYKKAAAVKALVNAHYFRGEGLTVGECSKETRLPKSTVRRILNNAVSDGMAEVVFEEYKSTGKNVFYVTDEGRRFLAAHRKEIGL